MPCWSSARGEKFRKKTTEKGEIYCGWKSNHVMVSRNIMSPSIWCEVHTHRKSDFDTHSLLLIEVIEGLIIGKLSLSDHPVMWCLNSDFFSPSPICGWRSNFVLTIYMMRKRYSTAMHANSLLSLTSSTPPSFSLYFSQSGWSVAVYWNVQR